MNSASPICAVDVPHRQISVLSTQGVAERDRFAFWGDMICAQYVQLQSERPRQQCFGELRSLQRGSLDLSRVRSNVPLVRRTKKEISRTGGEFVFVHLCNAASAVVRQHGRETALRPGDVTIYESGSPYNLQFDDLCDTRVMRVPRDKLALLVPDLSARTAVAIPSQLPEIRLYRQLLWQVWGEGEALAPSAIAGVSDALTSCIAAALSTVTPTPSTSLSRLDAYHVAKAMAYIHANLRDSSLEIDRIAHATGVSTRHLARLFSQQPRSVMRTVWHLRLEACKRELSSRSLPEKAITDIAFAWGFSNAGHFSTKFREAYGLAPRDWASAHRDLVCAAPSLLRKSSEPAPRMNSMPVSSEH